MHPLAIHGCFVNNLVPSTDMASLEVTIGCVVGYVLESECILEYRHCNAFKHVNCIIRVVVIMGVVSSPISLCSTSDPLDRVGEGTKYCRGEGCSMVKSSSFVFIYHVI